MKLINEMGSNDSCGWLNDRVLVTLFCRMWNILLTIYGTICLIYIPYEQHQKSVMDTRSCLEFLKFVARMPIRKIILDTVK